MAKPSYTGPDYNRGITINGTTYDPKSWTAKEITSYCAAEPRLKQYFSKGKNTAAPVEE